VRRSPPGGRAGALHKLYAERLAREDLRADAAQGQAIEPLEALRSRLLAHSHGGALARAVRRLRGGPRWPPERGIYLCGPVGRGKTFLMDLFLQSLPGRHSRRRHFHRFMQEVHASLRSLTAVSAPLESVAERIAREVRVLCLDELQVTDIGDAMILGGLLAGLFARGVTLVATANVPPGDLYRGGLQRERFLPAIALIERHTELVEVAGPTDYRLRELTQAGTYLPAGAAATPARLGALFRRLGGEPLPGRALELAGRSVAVLGRTPRAVWFDFVTLCASARSAEDYIEIAREYRYVFLSDIPVLGAAHEDEARRLVVLVDALYDHAVALIVSAAAAPDGLYRGERLVREFARTASRLTEMQTAEYLAREHRP